MAHISVGQRLGRHRSRLATLPSAGAGGPSYAIATGGTITTDTPTEVTHTFASSGTLTLSDPGIVPISYSITGTASVGGYTVDGSGYAGTPVAVVVTSGSVEVTYDPTDLIAFQTNEAWFAADDAASITASGGNVTAWNDRSGNGNHLPSVVGTPRTGDATLNGRNVLSFAGNERLYGTPASPVCADHVQVFMVVDWGTPLTYQIPPLVLTAPSTQGRPFDRWSSSSHSRTSINTGSSLGWTNLRARTAAELYRLTIEQDGGGAGSHTISEHFDGALAVGPTNSSASWSTASQVMYVGERGDGVTDFVGDVGEIIALNRLSDTATVEGYLNWKWLP